MRSFAVLSLMAVTGIVNAQNVIPTTVPLSTRDSWCQDQTSSCPILCSQTTNSQKTQHNSCDPATLSWACVCSDGTVPNGTQYSMPIPFHECQEYGSQCAAACPSSDSNCAHNCQTQYPCGAQAPTRVNATSSSSSSAPTGTSTGLNTFGGNTKNGGERLVELGKVYGMGVAITGFLAAVVFML